MRHGNTKTKNVGNWFQPASILEALSDDNAGGSIRKQNLVRPLAYSYVSLARLKRFLPINTGEHKMADDTAAPRRRLSTSLTQRREAFEQTDRAARDALEDERKRRSEKSARLKAARQQAEQRS
jgi:hypothetical protein